MVDPVADEFVGEVEGAPVLVLFRESNQLQNSDAALKFVRPGVALTPVDRRLEGKLLTREAQASGGEESPVGGRKRRRGLPRAKSGDRGVGDR